MRGGETVSAAGVRAAEAEAEAEAKAKASCESERRAPEATSDNSQDRKIKKWKK